MAKRGRPPKKSGEITIKSRETQVFMGFIFLAIGVSLFVNNSLTGTIPQLILRNFGQTTYVLGAIFVCMGFRLIGVKLFFTTERFISGLALLLFTLLPMLTFWIPVDVQSLRASQGEGGGIIGLFLHQQLFNIVGRPAELGILLSVLIVAVSILSGISLAQFGDIMNTVFTFFYRILSSMFTALGEKMPKPELVAHQKKDENAAEIISGQKKESDELDEENILHISSREKEVEEIDLPALGVDDDNKGGKIKVSYGPDLQGKSGDGAGDDNEDGASDLDAEFRTRYTPKFGDWVFPPLDLLEPSSPDKFKEEDVYERGKQIEQTLATFKIQARVAKIFVGPTIIQYALNLAPGTKVSKITGLSKDIGLALASASESIRIASISGTSLVGIEVPRQQSQMVRLREVLETKEMSKDLRRLPLAIGKDVRGDIVVEDLQQMPHLLVAGATGTGKSVTINDLLMGFLMKFTPDELKMILVDPKMVEMSVYNDLPYLVAPVITDMDKVVSALDWAIWEMTQRYKLFKEKGVRNLDEFNEQSPYRLPYLILAIDEMADLILTKKAEVEQKIVRLAQLARATGIHLILATQRPSVNVITGLIKANIPARIALGVTSGVDSRVILDDVGAESLIGKGDMLVKSPNAGKTRRVQAAFISTKEINRITDFIKQRAKLLNAEENWYDPKLMEEMQASESGGAGTGGVMSVDGMDDPLFRQAVALVTQQGKASASSLQRYLKIGFNRAARLIDQMTEMGIVAPGSGSKPREVLVSGLEDVFGEKGSGEEF